MTTQRSISFSPPDIRQEDIDEVVDALKSGWITTGPKTKAFECDLAAFTHAARVACLSSATTALECALRALGIGPGDEVITSAYTYTASASPIVHVGATPVLVDVAPGSYEMDYAALAAAVTEKTRAVVPVDIAGMMCDYDRIFEVLDGVRDKWHPQTSLQAAFDRVPIIADAAHSLGATYRGQESGSVADFTTFSFHAVKNLTTAEGGALAWRANPRIDDDALYHEIMLLSLHGQTKDALTKARAGAWEYDIAFPGYKCNMTDLQAALGLSQLRRYPALIDRRHAIAQRYERNLAQAGFAIAHETHRVDPTQASPRRALSVIAHTDDATQRRGSAHLMLMRLVGRTRAFRDALIEAMAEAGVATNVHYKPLPLLTAYRDLGFSIDDYPNAHAQFENEITLPLHTLLSDDDVDCVCEVFAAAYADLDAKGLR